MPKHETQNSFYWITWEIITVSLCSIKKEKFLSKNSMKNTTCKFVPGPFWFSKNPLWNGIWGSLHAEADKFR